MKSLHGIRLVIFDLDGTLIDAYAAITASFNHAMRALGFPLQKPRTIKKAVGWGDAALLCPFIGRENVPRALQIYRQHHKQALLKKSRLIKGARATLYYLRKKGYRLAVASNRPSKFSRILIKHLKIDAFFDAVLCGDEFTKGKPDPQIIFTVLKRLSVAKSKALYVGDMALDVQTGNAAGVKTIAVLTGSSTRSEIVKYKPHRIMRDISFLRRLL